MSLSQEVHQGPPTIEHKPSKITTWLDSLDLGDRAAAIAALDNPEWTTAAVRALYARHGLEVSASVIGEYRKARPKPRSYTPRKTAKKPTPPTGGEGRTE